MRRHLIVAFLVACLLVAAASELLAAKPVIVFMKQQHAGNWLAGDPYLYGRYRMEADEPLKDSSSYAQELTETGTVTSDTSIYKEGFASSDFGTGNNYYSITNSELIKHHPFKQKNIARDFTVSFWMYRNPTETGLSIIFSKNAPDTGKKGYNILSDDSSGTYTGTPNSLYIQHTPDGASYENIILTGFSLQASRWYFVTATYQADLNRHNIYMWDDTAGEWMAFTEAADDASTPLYMNNEPLTIATRSDFNSGANFDGKLDELMIFSRALQPVDIDALKNQTYEFIGNDIVDIYRKNPEVFSYFRFEPGHLLTDSSIYSINLTGANDPSSYTTTFKEGRGAVFFDDQSNQIATITDYALPPGHPLKSTTGEHDLTTTFWFYMDQYNTNGAYLLGKWGQTDDKVYRLFVDSSYGAYYGTPYALCIEHGIDADAGVNGTGFSTGTRLNEQTWYFVAATYAAATNTHTVKIWNDTTRAWVDLGQSSFSHVGGMATVYGASPLVIGNADTALPANDLDGAMDEFIIWGRVLGNGEMAAVKDQRYRDWDQEYAGDDRVWGVYRFEGNDALGRDDSGKDQGMTALSGTYADKANYIQGSASLTADTNSATGTGIVIADEDLATGHPLKSTSSEHDFSVTAWFKTNGEKPANEPGYIFSKAFSGDFYGENLISNGHFTYNTAGWTAVNSTLTADAAGYDGNALKITTVNAGSSGSAQKTITGLEVGEWYRISGYFSSGVAGTDPGLITIGDSNYQWWANTVRIPLTAATNQWNPFNQIFKATTSTAYLMFVTNSTTADASTLYDSIVLEKWNLGNERIGPNLVVNGDFSDATSTDSSVAPLTGWYNAGTHDANSKWTISDGQCTMITDGTLTQIEQYPLVSGKTYWYKIKVSDVSAGSLKLFFGVDYAHISKIITAPGLYTGFFVSEAATFGMKWADTAGNVTFDDIEIREIRRPFLPWDTTQVIDGNFTDGGTSWSDFGSGTATVDYSGGQATVTMTSDGSHIIRNTLSKPIKAGHTYYYEFNVISNTSSADLAIAYYNGIDDSQVYGGGTATQQYVGFFTAKFDSDVIDVGAFGDISDGDVFIIDDVAILEAKSLINGFFSNSMEHDSTELDFRGQPYILGWLNSGTHNATNKLIIDIYGTGRLISDGTLVSVEQVVLDPGQWYFYSVDVLDVTSGAARIRFGSEDNAIILDKVGHYSGYIKADDVRLYFKRTYGNGTSVTDVTIDNLIVEKISGFSLGIFIDDASGTKTGTANSLGVEYGLNEGGERVTAIKTGLVPKPGRWYHFDYHFAAVNNENWIEIFDPETDSFFSLYPNNYYYSSEDYPGTTGSLIIGGLGSLSPEYNFNGNIDELVIWDRVITTTDMWNLSRDLPTRRYVFRENDFTDAEGLYGLYLFETTATVGTDSSPKGQDLTTDGSAYVTTTEYAQGSGSTDCPNAVLVCTDADLATGHPFKSTTGEHDFSVTAWIERYNDNTNYKWIFSKGSGVTNKNTYAAFIDDDQGTASGTPFTLIIQHGYNGGADMINYSTGFVIYPYTWYFLQFTYDASTNTHRVRIHGLNWTWGAIFSQAGPADMSVSDANFVVQGIVSNGWSGGNFNGRIDEVTIWDRIITDAEANQICFGRSAQAPEYGDAINYISEYGGYRWRGGNDTTGDPDVYGHYKFDENGLAVDSSDQGQDLTPINTPATDENNYAEGSTSAKFVRDLNQKLYRADADLATGHPLKNATGETDFSITGWLKFTRNNWELRDEYPDYGGQWFFGKLDHVSGKRQIAFYVTGSDSIIIDAAYGDGEQWAYAAATQPLFKNQWYFTRLTYSADTNTFTFHIWDDKAQEWLTPYYGNGIVTLPDDMALGTEALTFGNINTTWFSASAFNGYLDDWIIWKRQLSSVDAELVKNREYTAALAQSSNFFAGDTDVYGIYNFEPGAITADNSDKDQTLSLGPEQPPVVKMDAMQGVGSAYFDPSGYTYLTAIDADLVTDNPFKSATGEHDFSVTGWFQRKGNINDSTWTALMGSATDLSTDCQYAIAHDTPAGTFTGTPNALMVMHGTGSGFATAIDTDYTLETDKWYFIHATYTATTNTHTVRLWDRTAGQWATLGAASGASDNNMSVGNAGLTFGNAGAIAGAYFNGLLDEFVIWDRVLSDTDANDVKDGTFYSELPVVTFDSSFEGGNGTNFSESPAGTFNVTTECDPSPAPTDYGDNFYFSLTNVQGIAPNIKVNFVNDRSGGPYEVESVQDVHPWYSYDNINWTHVTTSSYTNDVKEFTVPNSGTATGNVMYIAFSPPYTYSDLLSDITAWNATGYLTANLDLGDSSDGTREMRYMEVGTGPLHIAVTARAHPREARASQYLKGVMDTLTSSDYAQLRDSCTFHVFPIINPDGVYKGWFRAFTDGEDANRDYDTAGPNATNEEDETYLLHTKYATFASDVDLHIDIHSSYEPPTLYRDSGEFSSSKEGYIEYLIPTYDDLDLWPTSFANNANPNLTTNTTWREGVYTQYGIDALLIEGGAFRTGTTGYITSAELQEMGGSLIAGAAEGLLDWDQDQKKGGSNDAMNDPDNYGHYKFDSGALETDSSGRSQTLTANNTPTAAGVYVAGDGAVKYTDTSNQYHSIADGDLATDNPFKSSTGEHDFSVTLWFYRESYDTNIQGLISKMPATGSYRTYSINIDDNVGTATGTPNSIYVQHGYASGASAEMVLDTDFAPFPGRWYFLHLTYTASTNTHTIRVWDQTRAEYKTLSQASNAAGSDMYVSTADLNIGRAWESNSTCLNGIIDDLTIWNTVLADADANDIRDRTYTYVPAFSCTDTDADVLYEPLSVDGAMCSGWNPAATGSATYADDVDISADSPCASQDYAFELHTYADGYANYTKSFAATDHLYFSQWIKLGSETLANGNATTAFTVTASTPDVDVILIDLWQGNDTNNCAAGDLCTRLRYTNTTPTLVTVYPSSPTVLSTGQWYKIAVEWDKAGNDVKYWIDGVLQAQDTANDLYQTYSPDQLYLYASSSYSMDWFYTDLRMDNDTMPTGCAEPFNCTDTDADLLYEPLSADGVMCSGWTPSSSGSSTYADNVDVSSDSPCQTEDYAFYLEGFGDGLAQYSKNFTASSHIFFSSWVKIGSESLANGNATGIFDFRNSSASTSMARIYLWQGNGTNNCSSGNLCTYLAYKNSSNTTTYVYPSSPTVLDVGTWYKVTLEWDQSGNDVAFWIDNVFQVQDTANNLNQTYLVDELLLTTPDNYSISEFYKDLRIDSDTMPTGCAESAAPNNDLSTEPNVFGHYRFDVDALETDSSMRNQTLTASNAPAAASVFIAGSGAVEYDRASTQYHHILNAGLAPGHPLKSTTGEHDFSTTFWFYRSAADTQATGLLTKYDSSNNGRSYAIMIDNSSGAVTGTANSIYIHHSYNSGASTAIVIDTDTSLSTGRWYFVHTTYTASTNGHTIRIWDHTQQQYLSLTQSSNTNANDLFVSAADLGIGIGNLNDTSTCFTGVIDDVTIWDKILPDSDANDVRDLNYAYVPKNYFDYSGNLFGVYNFEPSALATDNSGLSQTLTANNSPISDTSKYIQGLGSVAYDTTSDRYHSRTDANLTSGHPFKSATGEVDFTDTFWMYMDTANSVAQSYIVSKWNPVSGGRKFAVALDSSSGVQTGVANSLFIYHGDGADSYLTDFQTDIELDADKWYWVQHSYDASTNGHKLRLWDQTASQWLYPTTFVLHYLEESANMNSGTGDFTISTRGDASTDRFFTGNLDELTIFGRVLSDFDGNRILNGIYNASSSPGNDFLGDGDVFGVYNFESGALGEDSCFQGNTLSDSTTPATADASFFIRGASSLNVDTVDNSYLSCTDEWLMVRNPLKAQTDEHDFSVTGWFMIEDVNTNVKYLISKYTAADGYRQFAIALDDKDGNNSGYKNAFYVNHGYNSGNSYYDTHQVNADLKQGYWYWFQHTYTASTNTHRTRLWDDSNQTWVTGGPVSTSYPGDDLYLGTADFAIGTRSDGDTTRNFDGRIDEVVVWDRVISDADGDAVREGRYSGPFTCSAPDADLGYDPIGPTGTRCPNWIGEATGTSEIQDDIDISGDPVCAESNYAIRMYSPGSSGGSGYFGYILPNTYDDMYLTFYWKVLTESLANGNATTVGSISNNANGVQLASVNFWQGNGTNNCASGNLCTYLKYRNSSETYTNVYPSSPTVISTNTWYKVQIKFDGSGNIAQYYINDTLQATDTGNVSALDADGAFFYSSNNYNMQYYFTYVKMDNTSFSSSCTAP